MTQDGEPCDPTPCESVVTTLMDECDNNGILAPYYNTGYGQYYVDRWGWGAFSVPEVENDVSDNE